MSLIMRMKKRSRNLKRSLQKSIKALYLPQSLPNQLIMNKKYDCQVLTQMKMTHHLIKIKRREFHLILIQMMDHLLKQMNRN